MPIAQKHITKIISDIQKGTINDSNIEAQRNNMAQAIKSNDLPEGFNYPSHDDFRYIYDKVRAYTRETPKASRREVRKHILSCYQY